MGHAQFPSRGFVNLQAVVGRLQQVGDVLIVNLHKGDPKQKLPVLGAGDRLEYLVNRPGSNCRGHA